MAHFPKYMFSDPIGPVLEFRPLWPRKLYNGRWAWLKKCSRQRMVSKSDLPGPICEFWAYTDH